jgi:hypothetical protein
MNTTAEQVEKLESLIASAQALIQEIKRPAVDENGWSAVQPSGKRPIPHATDIRQGCAWNSKETRDLLRSWFGFAALETLAQRHKRSLGAVRSQLQHLLYASNIEVILDELCPKD